MKRDGGYWLAPGELPMEAQFTEFQQGARRASLVTNNRPGWYANIETELNRVVIFTGSPRREDLPSARKIKRQFKFFWNLLDPPPADVLREEGAGVEQRRYVGGCLVDPTRSAALCGPRERRFVGPAAGPHGVAHAFWRSPQLRQRGAGLLEGRGAPFGASSPCALLILY